MLLNSKIQIGTERGEKEKQQLVRAALKRHDEKNGLIELEMGRRVITSEG
jgi:hypothetical protein